MTKHLNALATAILAGLIATSSQAEPYTIIIYEPAHLLKDRLEKTEGAQAYWSAYTQYASQLAAESALRGGAALANDAVASVSRDQAVISGYFQIEAQDDAAAKRLTALVPLPTGGRAEVHKDLPNPTMVQH